MKNSPCYTTNTSVSWTISGNVSPCSTKRTVSVLSRYSTRPSLRAEEREQFDEQNAHARELYEQLRSDFLRLTQQQEGDDSSNQQQLEDMKQLLARLGETNTEAKELARVQRLLTSKGHRVDLRTTGELNTNLKHLDGEIHHEIERMERGAQAEHDFHRLDKELEGKLHMSSEQMKLVQHHPNEQSTSYQVGHSCELA